MILTGLVKPDPKPPQIDAWASLTEAIGAKYVSRLTFEALWAPKEVLPRTDHEAPQDHYMIYMSPPMAGLPS